jgi:hypothetical protein
MKPAIIMLMILVMIHAISFAYDVSSVTACAMMFADAVRKVF